MVDHKICWIHRIPFICSRLSRNTNILLKPWLLILNLSLAHLTCARRFLQMIYCMCILQRKCDKARCSLWTALSFPTTAQSGKSVKYYHYKLAVRFAPPRFQGLSSSLSLKREPRDTQEKGTGKNRDPGDEVECLWLVPRSSERETPAAQLSSRSETQLKIFELEIN